MLVHESSLRSMTAPEFDAWVSTSVPAYAEDKVRAGQWARADALALARAEFDEDLPQGLLTPDNHLYTIVDTAGMAVGQLWIAQTVKFGQRIAYVYDVEIRADRQREGWAQRAFADLEAEVRRLGLAGIGLHVFGHNHGARALYEKLGFEPTNLHLFKPLSSVGGAVP